MQHISYIDARFQLVGYFIINIINEDDDAAHYLICMSLGFSHNVNSARLQIQNHRPLILINIRKTFNTTNKIAFKRVHKYSEIKKELQIFYWFILILIISIKLN